jgi:hypothetical protein
MIKERFSKNNTPPLFIGKKYFQKWDIKADNQMKGVLGEIPPAFFAHLFMLSTGILFETNLPTGITCGDEDLIFHNTKLMWDGKKTAAEFALDVLKAGGGFCVVSVKNWSLPTIHNFLPEQIEDVHTEFKKIDPHHFGKWILVIPHVPYPILKQLDAYGIEVIQTDWQIFPLEADDPEVEAEQKRIMLHWLRIQKEKLQPLLIEYFKANICYNSDEILDEYLITPIVNTQHHHFIRSSSNSLSRKNMKSPLES